MSTGGVKLGSSYDEARTRKVNAEAEIAELELAKIKGVLVVAEDVVKAWEDVLGAFKGKLLSIPSKAAPILAAELEAGMCQKVLEDLVTEVLMELSNYDPKVDPGTAAIISPTSEESDGDTKSAAKAKRKPVGRPKKTTRLANK
ncbi:MAG: hypothetical protein VXU48_02590 [Verrucomicrobiota bacterium]|nr:hypothetical protein [Verrucomicrobiota bacterium]